MYKKSNSFVYKFVVNCQVFEITPSEDNMGQTVIVPRYKFTKNISRSHKKAFYGTLSRIIPILSVTSNCQGYFKVEKSAFKEQYASSRIVS